MMDCDGFQKARVTDYDNSDSEIEAFNNEKAEQVQQDSDDQSPDQKL